MIDKTKDRTSDIRKNKIIHEIAPLIKKRKLNSIVTNVLKNCKTIDDFIIIYGVITNLYYSSALDKWRSMSYEEAIWDFRDGESLSKAFKDSAKINGFRNALEFSSFIFKAFRELVLIDYEFQKIFDAGNLKELFSACVMTCELALSFDTFGKRDKNDLEKLVIKFPVFNVLLNVRMFCLFSLLNTILPLLKHLLSTKGENVLNPQNFKSYKTKLSFEKCRSILVGLDFYRAKQSLDALENFILFVSKFHKRKIETLSSEEEMETFAILNSGSMSVSKSYPGFVVKSVEELKQKHSDFEKTISEEIKKTKLKTKPIEPEGKKAEYVVYVPGSGGMRAVIDKRAKTERQVQKKYVTKKEKFHIFVYEQNVYKKVIDEGKAKMISLNPSISFRGLLILFLKYKDVHLPYVEMYHKAFCETAEYNEHARRPSDVMNTLKNAVNELKREFEYINGFNIPRAKNSQYICEGDFNFCLILKKDTNEHYTMLFKEFKVAESIPEEV